MTAKAHIDGCYRSVMSIKVRDLQVEQLVQDGSGPFQRAHLLDVPSLVYLPPAAGGGAAGCFGEPQSHRSFLPFGTVVVVPAHVPLHVRSPGLGRREMIIARFDEQRFGKLTGVGRQASAIELSGCADVRANGVVETMERLWIEFKRPSVAQETMIAGLGLVLLGDLSRHFETLRARGTATRGTLAGWQRTRIADRLAMTDMPPPNIDELARLCGIGRRHLMRAWKASTGTTVMEHVERTRLSRGAQLLEAGALPVKAIASVLGYASQGSFASAFRRRFGESPRAWHARCRVGGL